MAAIQDFGCSLSVPRCRLRTAQETETCDACMQLMATFILLPTQPMLCSAYLIGSLSTRRLILSHVGQLGVSYFYTEHVVTQPR